MRVRLTDKTLKGLKAASTGQVDCWDAMLPGFGVRVGTGGRKSFFVGTRINGKYRRITLKPPYPALELAQARKQAQKIIADAAAGIGPERKQRGTFGAVAIAFMSDYAKDLRTRGEYQRKIDVELAAWHDRPITDIKRSDVKEMVRTKARIAPVSANRLLALIRKIFNWAVREEYLEASPAVQIDPPGKETERERSLSADEIKTVWSAFDKMSHPWGAIYKLLLLTGQRRGEVGGMKWSEVTAEGWKLPGERAKRGKGHLIPLSSLAREILDGVPEAGEFVFRTRNDGPPKKWSAANARLRKLCGPMEAWHIHDLRRTFATHMRSIGIDRIVVSKLLNHAEAGVTKIYDRYAADPEKTAAMERWANRLREIISGVLAANVVQLKAAK